MQKNDGPDILVIGGDAAGMSFASKVKRARPDWRVTVLEKGEHVSYSACGIPYFVGGEVPDLHSLEIITADQFRTKRDIDVRMGWEAVAIDREHHRVAARHVSTGEEHTFPYDTLMIGTGAKATIPPVEGIDLHGIFTARNLEDAAGIHRYIDEQQPENGLILGGGYIGLEMAEALRSRKISVHLVEMLPQVLNPLDSPIVSRVMEELELQGVTVHLNAKVIRFEGRENRVTGACIEGREQPVPAELVVLGSGVRARSELAGAAGLRVGEWGGIVVDERQRTSDPDIYAGGDCVEQTHLVTGRPAYIPLGPAANKHGRVAAINATGGEETFPGVVGTAVMKVFGLTISRTGLTESQAAENGFDYFGSTIQSKERAGYYPGGKKLTIHVVAEKASGRLLGAQIVGGETAAKRIDPFAVALYNRMRLHDIAQLDLSYAPPYSPVLDPVNVAAQVGENRRRKLIRQ